MAKRIECIFNKSIKTINSEFLIGARIGIFYMNNCRLFKETKDFKHYSNKNIHYVLFAINKIYYTL